jgi:AcrR family transcriptional regulator
MAKIKDKTKEEIRVDLIVKSREIIKDKAVDNLTARKLAEYSGYVVGTIYNRFKSMDELIMWENCLTLDELYENLKKVEMTSCSYTNLNRLLDCFVEYVLNNKNLWFTLYNFHFKSVVSEFEIFYLRRILKIIQLLENNLCKLFSRVKSSERKVITEALFVSLFALSSLLTTEQEFKRLDKKYVMKIMFNTYLTGASMLAKK